MTMFDVEQGTKVAMAFLRAFAPEGPWHLFSYSPDRKNHASALFGPASAEHAEQWIRVSNGKNNLYFHVNRAKDGIKKKASKSEMAWARFLHVDIDPPSGNDLEDQRAAILRRLTTERPTGVPLPTFIVDSGGGYWGFWRLSPEVALINDSVRAEVESRNLRLSQLLGGDSTHDVSRLARLPGTLNIPDATKVQKGRVQQISLVVSQEPVAYKLGDFEAAIVPRQAPASTPASMAVSKISELSELDQWKVEDRIKVIVAQGRHPDEGPKGTDDSRSAWMFDAVCGLVRAGVPDEVVLGILLDPKWSISDSVLDKDKSRLYAERQLRRAKDHVVDPDLMELNERHAAILDVGGKTRIARFDEAGRVEAFQSFEDVRNFYSNRIKTAPDGKSAPLGMWWSRHPQRRNYTQVVFDPDQVHAPDVLNLWTGFNVVEREGDWSLMRAHIEEVLADGDHQNAEGLLNWTAWTLQNPGRRAETAVVLMGDKGCGKGTFGNALCHIFHPHDQHLTSAQQLVGNFNAHLRDCCFIFADEAFWPGNKGAEGTLKALITEPFIIIEGKGLDAVQMPNRLHILMATNEAWAVPASGRERRYAVLRVPSTRVGDKPYFRAIDQQLKSGGYEAMLYDLRRRQLGNWHPRDWVPETDALNQQREESLTPLQKVLFDCLQLGELPEFCSVRADGSAFVPTSEFAALVSRRDPRISVTAVGRFLGDAGGRYPSLGFEKVDNGRPRGFVR